MIDEILKYKSLAVVGMEKNTGKTETLNYVLFQLSRCEKRIAVTSIGVDGETIDSVTQTAKPEITIYDGMIFVTSEKHYHMRTFTSEILDISVERTSLGRLVTAQAKATGKILLSGPANTALLQKTIENNCRLGADITVIDGALSRLSPASPSVTEAMILATGAAYSASIAQLVKKTKFVYCLISLALADAQTRNTLQNIDKGLWAIDANGALHDLKIESAFMLEHATPESIEILHGCTKLFVAGVVSDKLLDFVRLKCRIDRLTLVATDFTKIFVSPETYNIFTKKGGSINVLHKTKLIAVTVNPVSPQGYVLDTKILQKTLSESVDVQVYDVVERGKL